MCPQYDEVDPSNFINSVSREKLNNLLLNHAESLPGVDILFGYKLSMVDRAGTVHLENDPTKMRGVNTYNDYTPASLQIKPLLVREQQHTAHSTWHTAHCSQQSIVLVAALHDTSHCP
jgi:hypothetical protein